MKTSSDRIKGISLATLIMIISASTTVTVWAYSTFSTKGESSAFKESVVQRLDRIENKLDRLLFKQRRD